MTKTENEDDGIVVPFKKRMTVAEYQKERQRIRDTYGDNNKEAIAKREQALAVFFYCSDWTQEELAEAEGQSQRQISSRLVFGRFLNFSVHHSKPGLPPPDLTQNRFFFFWKQTDRAGGNERQRFIAVMRLMSEQTNAGTRGIRLNLGSKIMEQFADGKWHSQDDIIEAVGGDTEPVLKTLQGMQKYGTYKSKTENKQVGKTRHWRIFNMNDDKAVSLAEINEKLPAIIKGLKAEGKKNMATIAIINVASLAHKLQQLLDEWNGKDNED